MSDLTILPIKQPLLKQDIKVHPHFFDVNNGACVLDVASEDPVGAVGTLGIGLCTHCLGFVVELDYGPLVWLTSTVEGVEPMSLANSAILTTAALL